ncbi:hypothetical protein [Streptosporangium sp. 'caverna']|uniref:hypothetical protein n=1 Tax=Streptosporangium sp. 'caverna' TaxID=2202249 RepID=UPI000D7E6492|nr:hypothetical protein [Streptosporangium sp. 'caverna']AWS46459.1 hypothetical protein DKM19_39305 [Streptosporangium sp. 'caverna']
MLRDPSICDACARLHRRRNPEAETTMDMWTPYCDAFPGGVPDAIFFGGFDHREEYPGDGGIRFVLREGEENVLRLYEGRTGVS